MHEESVRSVEGHTQNTNEQTKGRTNGRTYARMNGQTNNKSKQKSSDKPPPIKRRSTQNGSKVARGRARVLRCNQGRSEALPGDVQRSFGAPPGPPKALPGLPEALPGSPEGSRIDSKTPLALLGIIFSSDLFAERFERTSRSYIQSNSVSLAGGPRLISLHRRSVS